MRKMLPIILVLAIVLSVAACSKPSFEQQRAATVEYLRAFNKVDNDLSQTILSIRFPSTLSAPNLLQFNNTLAQRLGAVQGGLQRANGLKAPDTDEARAHLEVFKKLLQDSITAIQRLQAAMSVGNQPGFTQAVSDITAIGQRSSALNRLTEGLMVKYNITDAEVDYRSRGE